LFTSSVFTNWISTHFSEATSTTFNPYLVSMRVIFWCRD
jgi:chitin synthase